MVDHGNDAAIVEPGGAQNTYDADDLARRIGIRRGDDGRSRKTEKPIFGKVVAVGKGKILESGEIRPLDVKVGDKILFGKYSGTEVKMDGDELVVMREEDIMAIVEGK